MTDLSHPVAIQHIVHDRAAILADNDRRRARALAVTAHRSADQRAVVTFRARALLAEHLTALQPVRRGFL